MIQAEPFIEAARSLGFRLFTGVPCSYLKPFINYVIDSAGLHYIGAANEGDAVAIASGAELGGQGAVVMFQNSGLGNAVNPLTSLNQIAEIPVLVITTWRGEPGAAHDEPQHALMGGITPGVLDLMQIPWEIFPTDEDQIAPVLGRAVAAMRATRRPYALVMRKDSVAPHALRKQPTPRALDAHGPLAPAWPATRHTRAEYLAAVQQASHASDLIVATTGYTGRELYALADRPNQLYLVGSMGCASSVGLGLAWAQPGRRVIVIDGDGAALMRLGALATIGCERSPNLLHILLDNEAHDSTGGQATASHSIDLGAVALACGYPSATRVVSPAALAELVGASTSQLTFVHVKTTTGAMADLPRPLVTPSQVAQRLRGWITNGSHEGDRREA